MNELRQQQIDALKMAADYMDKLIPSMEQVIGEIKGEQQDDTIDFLVQIIDGFNFVIEIYNATEQIMNGGEPIIDKSELEAVVGKLSDGFAKRDYVAIANYLDESIVPFLKAYRDAAAKVA